LAASLQLPADVEGLAAEQILEFVLAEFPGRVSLACSFQKEESVLLDMLYGLEPKARVFALDTHVLFPETYDVWRAVEKRYGTTVEVYEGPSLGRQAAVHGDALWERKPDLCCSIRKVEPLNRALAELDCWITGLRRDQSPARANAPKLGWDEAHELWKANPLADWTDERCRAYVRERDLPVNPLYERGYASIGCTHCTLPGAGREGRWAGSDKVECGLHTVGNNIRDLTSVRSQPSETS
jgi:phosphoadenosine phosphosulfate reductase